MKKILLSALLAFLALPAFAQEATQIQIPLIIDYDLDSTTFIYPVSQAQVVAAPAGTTRTEKARDFPGIPGPSTAKIMTVGKSTSIAAQTAGTGPFQAVQAGDLIVVTTQGITTPDLRDATEGSQTVVLKVVTRADADNITVNQAVDLSTPTSFYWRRVLVDTQAGYGWMSVRSLDSAAFNIYIVGTTDGAGINVRLECREELPGLMTGYSFVVVPSHTGATAATECGAGALTAADQSCLFADALGALRNKSFQVDTQKWAECRLGMRINTADDGADAVIEAIRVDFVGTSHR